MLLPSWHNLHACNSLRLIVHTGPITFILVCLKLQTQWCNLCFVQWPIHHHQHFNDVNGAITTHYKLSHHNCHLWFFVEFWCIQNSLWYYNLSLLPFVLLFIYFGAFEHCYHVVVVHFYFTMVFLFLILQVAIQCYTFFIVFMVSFCTSVYPLCSLPG